MAIPTKGRQETYREAAHERSTPLEVSVCDANLRQIEEQFMRGHFRRYMPPCPIDGGNEKSVRAECAEIISPHSTNTFSDSAAGAAWRRCDTGSRIIRVLRKQTKTEVLCWSVTS